MTVMVACGAGWVRPSPALDSCWAFHRMTFSDPHSRTCHETCLHDIHFCFLTGTQMMPPSFLNRCHLHGHEQIAMWHLPRLLCPQTKRPLCLWTSMPKICCRLSFLQTSGIPHRSWGGSSLICFLCLLSHFCGLLANQTTQPTMSIFCCQSNASGNTIPAPPGCPPVHSLVNITKGTHKGHVGEVLWDQVHKRLSHLQCCNCTQPRNDPTCQNQRIIEKQKLMDWSHNFVKVQKWNQNCRSTEFISCDPLGIGGDVANVNWSRMSQSHLSDSHHVAHVNKHTLQLAFLGLETRQQEGRPKLSCQCRDGWTGKSNRQEILSSIHACFLVTHASSASKKSSIKKK